MTRLSPETLAAMRAARVAGGLLLSRLGRIRRIAYKTPKDLVTSADLAAERTIRRLLEARFPRLGFLGEEGGRTGRAVDDHWVVDPLDGTTSFVSGFPTFAVCIALVRDGRVVTGVTFLPRLGELFVAERGRGTFLNGRRIRVSRTARLDDALLILWQAESVWRDRRLRERLARLAIRARTVRSEGAGFSLAYVAAGRAEAYWEQDAWPWDMAAGALLVAEAGGRVTADHGGPLGFEQRTILASNGHLHSVLVAQLGRKKGVTDRTRRGSQAVHLVH